MSGWIWICPEEKGGIRWYSESLWKELVVRAPRESRLIVDTSLVELAKLRPSLIHIQHEYGCFGSKVPGRYTFPRWVRQVRRALPETRIVATAHSVVLRNYRYPVAGRGWQAPLRGVANATILPLLTRWWNTSTWGAVDATIVQQAMYVDTIKLTKCPIVREIPLFVPDFGPDFGLDFEIEENVEPSSLRSDRATVLVFGFFSPEKGQDVAIKAIKELPESVSLVLAGGVRRTEDQPFFDHCQELINSLNLQERVKITGFVSDADLDQYYRDSVLVLAPFRESTGSGSLSHAFARGKPVLASDLPVNLEVVRRVPGSLCFFKSEDPRDCARQIQALLGDENARRRLSEAAKIYAEKYSIQNSIQAHLDLYRELGV